MWTYKKSAVFMQEKESIINELVLHGVPDTQAEIMADCLATSDIYGVTTHGKAVLPAHIERIKRGKYNLAPDIKVLRETSAFAIIDGDNAIGPVSAEYCMRYAVRKSKQSGVFTVFAKSNNTLGPAFYYSLLAAQENMIGIVATNSPAQMAPAGGVEKMLGTNPFSAVIPVADSDPIIIDFASSVVAKSKLKEYVKKGEKIPKDWALDSEGNPTDDPNEAINGLMLPMSGFKGYGIALLIDLVAGFMSGASYLNHVERFYSENKAGMDVGYFMFVINPQLVFGHDYNICIKKYVEELRNSKAIDGHRIILPGDDRIENKNKSIL